MIFLNTNVITNPWLQIPIDSNWLILILQLNSLLLLVAHYMADRIKFQNIMKLKTNTFDSILARNVQNNVYHQFQAHISFKLC